MASTHTITAYYTFAALTRIKSAEVNSNFQNYRGHIDPIEADTISSSHLEHDLGYHDRMWRGVYHQYGVMYQNDTHTSVATPTATAATLFHKADGFLYSKFPAGTVTSYLNRSVATTKGDLFVATANDTVTRQPVGADGTYLKANSATTTGFSYDTPTASLLGHAGLLENFGLGASVGSSALTLYVKQVGGSLDPASASGAVKVGFRSATSNSGAGVLRSIETATSLTIPSTATLGFASGSNCYAYIYLLDNAGTPELAVSTVYYDEHEVVSSTAIGTGSDSNGLYSTSARSNVAIRLVGRFKYTTAPNGTYSAVPDILSVKSDHDSLKVTGLFENKNASAASFPTSGQYGDAGSGQVLQPGKYRATGAWFCFYTAGTVTFVTVGLGQTSGNNTPGGPAETLMRVAGPTSSNDNSVTMPGVVFDVAATSTYYTKVRADYNSTAPQYAYRMTIERIQ